MLDRLARKLGRGKESSLNCPNQCWPRPAKQFMATTRTGFKGVSEQFGKGIHVVYGYNALLLEPATCRIYYCGLHVRAEDAARAYDARARLLGWKEEKLNFPHDPKPAAVWVDDEVGEGAGGAGAGAAKAPPDRKRKAEAGAGPAVPAKQARKEEWTWRDPASAARVEQPGGDAFLEELEAAADAESPPSLARMRNMLEAATKRQEVAEAGAAEGRAAIAAILATTERLEGRSAKEAAAAARLRERLHEAEREERARVKAKLQETHKREARELREKAEKMLADADKLADGAAARLGRRGGGGGGGAGGGGDAGGGAAPLALARGPRGGGGGGGGAGRRGGGIAAHWDRFCDRASES